MNMGTVKEQKCVIGNWKLNYEKRVRLVEIEKLKKKAIELQSELAGVVSAIAQTEEQITTTKKGDEKAWLEVVKVRVEQQAMLSELSATIRDLETKLPLLKKEKEEAEEANKKDRMELALYDNALREKEAQLEKLRCIMAVKKQDLNELMKERREMETDFEEKMRKLIMEDIARRKENFRCHQEEVLGKIETYTTRSKELEKYMDTLTEEKALLQDVIEDYTERLALLRQKETLLATEILCLASSSVNTNQEALDGTCIDFT